MDMCKQCVYRPNPVCVGLPGGARLLRNNALLRTLHSTMDIDLVEVSASSAAGTFGLAHNPTKGSWPHTFYSMAHLSIRQLPPSRYICQSSANVSEVEYASERSFYHIHPSPGEL